MNKQQQQIYKLKNDGGFLFFLFIFLAICLAFLHFSNIYWGYPWYYQRGVNDTLNNYICYEKHTSNLSEIYYINDNNLIVNPSFKLFNKPTIQISKDYCWEVTCPCAREQPACTAYCFECKEGAFDSLK